MTVSEIRQTRIERHPRCATAQPDVVSDRGEMASERADQGRVESVGFSAGATSLTTSQGVRGVLLEMLGAEGTASTDDGGAAKSYRELIAKDIKTAYGREATSEDYDYWMGKLEGPNDSGFVTSGKMTATEYWHRRMLGWQAGGSDVATSGPYAGGDGPHGEVPAASELVPSVPQGGVYNTASAERIAGLRDVISTDIRTAYGREATDEEYGYWLNKFLGPNDSGFVTGGSMSSDEYWHRRLLGWQAGGADVALFGPYAGR